MVSTGHLAVMRRPPERRAVRRISPVAPPTLPQGDERDGGDACAAALAPPEAWKVLYSASPSLLRGLESVAFSTPCLFCIFRRKHASANNRRKEQSVCGKGIRLRSLFLLGISQDVSHKSSRLPPFPVCMEKTSHGKESGSQ